MAAAFLLTMDMRQTIICVINYRIRACSLLYCKIGHAAPTNTCTYPIYNDPVVVTIDGKRETKMESVVEINKRYFIEHCHY